MKKFREFFIYAVLVLVTLLVYRQVGSFDFVNYDDTDYVYKNPQVLNGLSFDGIAWAFASGHAANWHPLTWMSLMLDCQLFGPNAGRMHLVNLVFHILNTLLVFGVLKKMTGKVWASAFAAALFAIHPMHVESVAWIAERKDMLSTFFLLLTLWAYAGYVRYRGVGRYLLTVLLFTFGLLSKPMLVTLPFLLLLLDYWPLDRFNQITKISGSKSKKVMPVKSSWENLHKVTIEKIPFFLFAAGLSVVTFLVQRAGGTVPDINRFAMQSRAANAFMSYIRYIGKTFWPENLAVFYPFQRSMALEAVVLCVLLLVCITALVIIFGRQRKYLPVGWFWFIGTLVPVIGLVQVGEQSYADRYSYISYIGLFIMIAWGAAELVSKLRYRKTFLSVAALIVLAVLSIVTYKQTGYWKNSFTLFTHAVNVTENNYIAYTNLGVAYGGGGDYSKALEACDRALKINSNCADAYYNLGVTYGNLGQTYKSLEAFKHTIRIKPNYAQGYNSLGVAYGNLGQWQDAIEAFKQATVNNSEYTEAYYNIGAIYGHLGQRHEEIEAYKQAIKIRPDYVKAHYNLGAAYLMTGQKGLFFKEYEFLKNIDVEQAGRLFELTNSNVPVKN